MDEKQGKQIAAHTFVIYRHTNAYAAVCRKEGYELQQYPKEFRASFGTEIDELFRKLAPYGISLAELERDLVDEEAARAIEKSVYDELEQMREGYIKMAIAEENGLLYEEVEWNEEWRELVSLEEICEIFDYTAMSIFKEGFAAYHFRVDGL